MVHPQMLERPLHVLIAEDTPASAKLLAAVLAKRGHAVEVAKNGEEAVRMVDSGSFDLVLMDIQMPIMDGLQATAVIRHMQETAKSHLPIVAVTAFALQGQRELCLAAGMNDFVTKPVDIRSLMTTVEKMAGLAG